FVFWGALVRKARPAFSRAMIIFVALGLMLGLLLMIVTTVTAFLKQGADLGSFRLDSILLGHPLVLALLLLGGDACLGGVRVEHSRGCYFVA
ncbi:hypothetical protein D0N87_28865, partial [Pseudomonas sp. ATCC 13867]